jgi:hypothetical protein
MKKESTVLSKGSTIFLRLAVAAIGLLVFAFCVALFFMITDGQHNYRTPVWLGLYAAAVPFYIALFQTLKLIGHIEMNKAFSSLSVTALKNIKYCGLAIAGLFTLGSPYIMYVAQRDDAPGLFAFALIFIGASFTVAVFAAVLERLLESAMALKKENDLTV